MARSRRRLVVAVGAAALIAFSLAGRAIGFYVDYLWFSSVGYTQVFFTSLWAGLGMFGAGFLTFFCLFLPNALLALTLGRQLLQRFPPRGIDGPFGRGVGPAVVGIGGAGGYGGPRPFDRDRPRPFGDLAAALGGPDVSRWVLERLGRQLVLITAVGLALALGLMAAARWEAVLSALNAHAFGVADPLFDRDIAFYVFALPVLRFMQVWLLWAVLLATGVVLAMYALALYSIDPTFEHALFHLLNRARAMRTHLLGLVACSLVVAAVGVWLGSFDVLLSRHDRLAGANFTDVHARLPAIQALAATLLLAAGLVLATVFRRDYTLPIVGVVLIGFVLIVGRGIVPFLVQRIQVEPAEIQQESPYIAHSIRFTRLGYGLSGMEEQTFPAEEAVRPEEIRASPETINNIRLWDHLPLRDTYNQIQSIRPYYAFDNVDIDRYVIDGQYRQVMLSARELAVDRLGQQAQTWVNRRLQYTHGYGVAMSPVNVVERQGLPAFLIQDIPPVGKLRVERPEVYYGQQTGRYVLVNTSAQEFDYPRGDQNVFTTYQDDSGVRIGPVWRRLALAWYFGDFNLLVSPYLRAESRVLFRRSIRDRVQRIAPFVKLDGDPYLVVADGRLVWIVDGYTISDRYPYSPQTVERIGIDGVPQSGPAVEPGGLFRRVRYNYIRNSVKITIDAYDGSVELYVADAEDPIIRTYARIYPGLLRPLAEMPAALRAHVRYPEDLFRVQAQILRAYHVQDPQVFYNSEDVWSTAQEQLAGRRQPVEPYYVIMRLPGQARAEFLLMLPFTPATRDNMIAWLAARSDGAEYGKLLLYKFPKDRLVYGPAQIDALIDQEPIISQQLSLWNQQGSRVIRGNLLVIPIGASTLYVEPIYLQAERGQVPELKRVVVATSNRLVMEPTLEEGLLRLFGPESGVAGAPPAGPPQGPSPVTSLPPGPQVSPEAAATARSAREAYQRALEALRGGDFARFGDELRRLEERLAELERATAP